MLQSTAGGSPALRRSVGLLMLILYGLGTTIGAGIYVLVGRIADRSGMLAPLSFVVAAVLVGFTALSYAEFAARHPRSGGEAIYVKQGFGRSGLATLVGAMVILTGLVSSAALAHGFAGYLKGFVPVPEWAAIVGIVVAIGLLAAWGIGQSVAAASLVTVIEIGGLVLLVIAGGGALAEFPSRWSELLPVAEAHAWSSLLGASFLAFFAFIGFGDMVNVAEEVKDVQRALPIAIFVTLAVTLALYVLVALVAVLSVPVAELGRSEAPLMLVAGRHSSQLAGAMGIIGMFAVLNGILVQIIMSSRVLYGMAREGWIHGLFARVHSRTQTPIPATACATVAVIVLALGFPIDTLAEFTSLLVLVIASFVNAALLRVKTRRSAEKGPLDLPLAIPAAGLVVSSVYAALILRDLLA